MKLRLFILLYTLLLVAVPGISFCKEDENFDCRKIPDVLLKNANAIMRKYHMEIHIAAANEVYITERYAITILNEKGSKYAPMREHYNKLSTIDDIHGWLYDKDGNEIDKIRKNAVKDNSSYDENFINDARVKSFSFNYSSYPYTCLYEIETKLSYTFFFPQWEPQINYDISVENADINIIYPKDFALRYRTFHTDNKPTIVSDGDDTKLSLAISAIPADEKPDDFIPVETFYRPTLICAADKFALQDINGNMTNWQDFGRFVYQLNANRDSLPDETKKIIHKLTDTCHSPNQKIGLLYEYLKKNTRYVSIQLGIGGLQTLEASFVAEKGYGDCKALTNFMKAMLKEVGITSYQALAYGGERENESMQLDFTYNAFNHVILCIPQQNDTIWLECTAKDLPPGCLTSFTGNRYVLLFTPSGGYPIKTPSYNHSNNLLIRKATISINDKDELTGKIDSKFQGWWWEKEKWIENQPKSKVENFLNREFAIPTYTITDYKINSVNTSLPEINERVNLNGSSSTTRSGKRIFVSPHVLRFSIEQPTSYDKRKKPFQLFHDFHISDTITINLYGSYSLESTQKEVNLDFAFASYASKISFENDSVLKVISTYDQKEGIYPPELFADYIKMCTEINNNAANERIVLSRKN